MKKKFKKNKKGEMDMLGIVLIAFLTIVVGVVLFTAIAQNVGDVTHTVNVANASITSTNGTTLALLTALSGKSVSSVVVYNGSDDTILTSGNYTIYNNQVRNGVEVALFNATTQPIYQGQPWNVSYTYEPTTYISNSSGRAVASIILIFVALAVALVALYPIFGSKVRDMIGI